MSYSEQNYSNRLIGILLALFITGACNIGGVGWDDKKDIEIAKQYPATQSNRIQVKVEVVPFQSFKQEFGDVFRDFPYSGVNVGSSPDPIRTQISGTPYTIAYENFVLKIFRDDNVIAERLLPNIFYMHSVTSGVILGDSRSGDRILCRTHSRATTGLHYILVLDGNGDILFERVLGAAEDWDVLPGTGGEIIIGGARSKIVISNANGEKPGAK